MGLTWNKLGSITADGEPSLIGKYVGLVKFLTDKMKGGPPNRTAVSFHQSPGKSVQTIPYILAVH